MLSVNSRSLASFWGMLRKSTRSFWFPMIDAEVIAEHHLTEAEALVHTFEFTCMDVNIASEDTSSLRKPSKKAAGLHGFFASRT